MPATPFNELESPAEIPGVVTEIAMREAAKIPVWGVARITDAQKKAGTEALTASLETLYAQGKHLTQASWRGVAQIAHKINASGFGDIGKNGRALAIYQVALRNAGLADGPDPASDPEINAAYGEPAPEV